MRRIPLSSGLMASKWSGDDKHRVNVTSGFMAGDAEPIWAAAQSGKELRCC